MFNLQIEDAETKTNADFLEGVYLRAVTITILGFGCVTPTGFVPHFSVLEAIYRGVIFGISLVVVGMGLVKL